MNSNKKENIVSLIFLLIIIACFITNIILLVYISGTFEWYQIICVAIEIILIQLNTIEAWRCIINLWSNDYDKKE